MRNNSVLTRRRCAALEDTRLAIEVLTGQRVRFVHVDFNSYVGKVLIEKVEYYLVIYFNSPDMLHFKLGGFDGWNIAKFVAITGEVWVMNESNPRKRVNDQHTMWWVGSSMTDRREEPLHP